MDIGKILRERANFKTYVNKPKKPGKKWGVYPSVKADELIFIEEEEFNCPVLLFSHNKDEIMRMQADAIIQASLGMKRGGWEFWLHAANHKITKEGGLYRSEIRFVFKVLFPINLKEEVK